MSPDELLALWYSALNAEFGIRIKNPYPNLVPELYTARKASGDPALENLRICKMKNGELWIVKNEVKMEDEDAPSLT
jgi:hypothetical protein